MPVLFLALFFALAAIFCVFYALHQNERYNRNVFKTVHGTVFLIPISLIIWIIVALVNHERYPVNEYVFNIQSVQNTDGTITQLVVESNGTITNFNAKHGKYLPAGKKFKRITWNSWSSGVMLIVNDTYEVE